MMISTKLSKKEQKEEGLDATEPQGRAEYSYGTSLQLNEELLTKLGFVDPPDVGVELMLHAKVCVVSTNVRDDGSGEKEIRCELQIKEMELTDHGKDAATVLYGKS